MFLVYPLRTGVMRRRRLTTLPNPLLYAFMAFFEFIHTCEVEINKMTTQILLNVEIIFTQGLHNSNWLISG